MKKISPKYSHILTVAVLGVAATIALVNTDRPTAPSVKPIVASVPSVLGKETNGTDYSLTIANHRYVESQDASSRRLTVQIQLVNQGNQTLQTSPGMQMFVKTASGSMIPATARYLEVNQVLGGPIEPKQQLLQNIDFDIPLDDSAKTFVFQPDASSAATEVTL